MEAEKLDHNLNKTSSSSTPTITNVNQTNDEINKIETLVMKATNLISGSNVYQMHSSPRGFCLIINNVDFDNNRYPRRVGSDEETQRFCLIFTQLHFEVSFCFLVYELFMFFNKFVVTFVEQLNYERINWVSNL
jgi:hypothetical protein